MYITAGKKEKFGGLRPSAYIASKVAFLACLVIAQSLWMAFFVNLFGSFRGDFIQHVGFLLLVNAAMTGICQGGPQCVTPISTVNP